MADKEVKCWHTVCIELPDWEAADKYQYYNPGAIYVKCMRCHKIMEVID